MQPLRAVARAAATTLRHQPVMAEDFGAQANSPQIACLKGVREADLVVLILGESYGAVQQSGLSATPDRHGQNVWGIAIGRKNYLFMGSDSGGQRATSFYSLIGTAKLCGLDPAFYLRTVLATISDHPINRIQELLPWNIANSLQKDSSQAA